MRGIVLVVLGGGLLWLVVTTFGDSGETLAAEPGTEGGIQVETVDGADPPAEALAREPQAEAPKLPVDVPAAPVQEPEPQRPAPEPRPERAVATPPAQIPTSAGLESEVALASLLLHDRPRLPDYLQGEGQKHSRARRDLALALAFGINGRVEQARSYAASLAGSAEISGAERGLLEASFGGTGTARAAALNVRADGPLALAGRMALAARNAQEGLRSGEWKASAVAFSELLQAELSAPWSADRETLRDWSQGLAEAQAHHRWNPRGDWPSLEVEVQGGDSLVAIRKRVVAERPALKICTGLIDRANGLGGRYLRAGQKLRIPTDPVSVQVFLKPHWTLYMHGSEVVAAWEVGIGKPGHETQVGTFTIGEKIPEPTWFQPGEAPVPFGDPGNALGTRWISWEGTDGLGFHGTNDPGGVGGDVSKGCIRMHNADVEELFEILPRGSRVTVRS